MCVLKMKFLPSVVQKLSSEQTHRQTDGQTDRWTDRQTHRQTDRQTDTQTDGQTDRHTDRQTRLKLLPTAYEDGNDTVCTNISGYGSQLYRILEFSLNGTGIH